MTFIINQLILVFYNYINSIGDAYLILKNKTIAHAINFGVYASMVVILIWAFHFDLRSSIMFCISSFFNRQLSFDISLNLRRGLPYYYQSTANPPKALMDRIERKLFGIDYNGKYIVLWYAIMYVISVSIYFIP